MKKFTKILLLALVLVLALAPVASAVEPYTTYTYGKDGWPRTSPTVYTPVIFAVYEYGKSGDCGVACKGEHYQRLSRQQL